MYLELSFCNVTHEVISVAHLSAAKVPPVTVPWTAPSFLSDDIFISFNLIVYYCPMMSLRFLFLLNAMNGISLKTVLSSGSIFEMSQCLPIASLRDHKSPGL